MYTIFFLNFSKLNYMFKVKSNNCFVYKHINSHFYYNVISIHFINYNNKGNYE